MVSARGLSSGLVLAGIALIATCYGFARFAYGLFAPQFATEFALSTGLSGVIAGGSYVGYCLAIGVSTILTARWGPRPVAISAGAIATAGITVVALSPSATVLAIGVLIAGSSTGVASPPLAAAVAHWIQAEVRDTAQTVVNAGTGFGVLISGPIALLLVDSWRLAWALFAVAAAAVTVWIALVIPAGGGVGDQRGDHQPWLAPGSPTLLVASFVLGLASIAVWTFGQDLVSTSNQASWLAPAVWMIIGAAGIAGAFSGPVVDRLGVRAAWPLLMGLMAVGSAGLALGVGGTGAALASGGLFGAAYIALTGVLLIWATRVYPSRPALGVGLAFFTIAAGQAVGAPLIGLGSDRWSLPTVFYACSIITLAGAAVRGPRTRSADQAEY